MKQLEYRHVTAARGSLLFLKGGAHAALGERVSIRDKEGTIRNGQVIRTSEKMVLVQVFESTNNLDIENTWVRYLDTPFELALSPDMLGRVFNGIGEPRDSRPPIVSSVVRSVNGAPVNPAARAYPREFIQTGISTIDGLNSL
ncbi:MAG: V-type ATP synthase subunit B, partial [Gammaproteobacteria bacterium]|nr:V-type ATP synthase subunit B [Gammaproteobacteria bacterium]